MSDKEIHGERTLVEGLLHYLAILLRYKVLIISITVFTAAAAVAFSIISLRLPPEDSPLPNQYRAYAVVVFQGGGGAGASTMLSAFGMPDPYSGGSAQAQLALQILRSRTFTDDVVERFDIIRKHNIQNMQKYYSRLFIQGSSEYHYNRDNGVLTIAFTSIDPEFAAEVVNYKVDLLDGWLRREGLTARSTQLSRMRETLDEIAEEISRIEGKIEEFQRRHGVLDIMEIAESQSAMLADLRTLLNQIELEIKEYSEYSTFEDPALISLRNRRNNILTQIQQVENGFLSSEWRRMPSRAELPRLALDFSHMQANLALQNQLYRSLSELYEVTRLTADQADMLSILEYAEVPDDKVGPSRGRLTILATFGAFAGSAALALFLNFLKNLKKDPEKVKLLKGERE